MGCIRKYGHLHLVFLFQLFFRLPFSTSKFVPTDKNLLDCGSTSPATLYGPRIFLSDKYHFRDNERGVPYTYRISVAAEPNTSIQLAPIYRTATIFPDPSRYTFNNRMIGTHIVRLHFYPFSTRTCNISSTRTCNLTVAQFHVLVSDYFVLLSEFTPSSRSPSVKEFIIRDDSKYLKILLYPVDPSSFSFVNAIEAFSAPDELIGDTARIVQSHGNFSFADQPNLAMETIFRVNVGGPKVTSFNDTLWRTWDPDTDFFTSDSITKIISFSGRIMYSKNGPSREIAPDSVYNTARVLDAVTPSNFSNRMSWNFHVDNGYSYLVRMHFCDIVSLAPNELYFNVYINDYLAYEAFDISSVTGQILASPYYLDFVTSVGSSGGLQVSVGPSKYGDRWRFDGLLNGLEIMKINSSIGCLEGDRSFDSVVKHVNELFNPSWETYMLGVYVFIIVGFFCLLAVAAEED